MCIRDRPKTQPKTSPPSSSSNLNITTKLTSDLSEDFKQIQIPQFLKDCSFGKTQLLQLQKAAALSAEEIQSSLEHFAVDYEKARLNIKTNPLNYLMGILRKQVYVSTAYLEAQRKEHEAYLKKIEALTLAESEMQKVLLQRAFEDWERKLSREEKASLVEYSNFVKPDSELETVMLRGHFEKEIYTAGK